MRVPGRYVLFAPLRHDALEPVLRDDFEERLAVSSRCSGTADRATAQLKLERAAPAFEQWAADERPALQVEEIERHEDGSDPRFAALGPSRPASRS